MKQIIALLMAVVLFGMTAGTAAAQGPDVTYTPTIPVHEGLNADGSVALDFSGSGFAPNQSIIVDVMGVQVAVAIGADYTGTYPASGPSLAGKAVTFTGEVEDYIGGPTFTTASKSFPAEVEPTPVPTAAPVVVVQQVVAPEMPGDPATAMNTITITTPKNLPAEPVTKRSPSVPLALTGNETSIPVMIGSGLILVGGLAIVASRRRTESI